MSLPLHSGKRQNGFDGCDLTQGLSLKFYLLLANPIQLILSKLAGIDDETVSRDYALTRVGREPAREMIMTRLAKEPLFASNNDAALNMFTCRYGHDY
jgi:hypothetical protein